MSLKKKIVLGFLISAVIIAVLAAFEYVNFIKIRREISDLEITDTIRSKSLQLRRHEKNYFLNDDASEREQVHDYIRQLRELLGKGRTFEGSGRFEGLRSRVEDYSRTFSRIEELAAVFHAEFGRVKLSRQRYAGFFHLVESTVLERPLVNAVVLRSVFMLSADNPAVRSLRDLDTEIQALRKCGEDILVRSKELDGIARENVDGFIRRSQVAILIVFPVFIAAGFGVFLVITGSVVKRLQSLTGLVGRAGGGEFSQMETASDGWTGGDEVGVLIRTFNAMELQLARREKELLQSKKLAAIGTLASGVAHELNNPLNNIYTTAQRLTKKTGEECPPAVRKGLDDIFSETMRVKGIVGDLLEFARGREPQMRELDLRHLLSAAFRHISSTVMTADIRFDLDVPEGYVFTADPEQMERVFINLFTNAVQATPAGGAVSVKAERDNVALRVIVSDTGTGMTKETLDKIFEPFYTTRDKGTGLGLAIVFNIIQKHGGTITAESEQGKGTTFTITLPVKALG
ncbi:MAG: ATP-binding protein [Nitrospiraceae bacterium]|nr:ATP-binding protein [Nitrospiraceae bacterium]